MKKILYITLLFLTPSFLVAQIDQPTIGAGYANQAFYNLNGTQTVSGTRIFCIKLRSGDYKKLEITSLVNGTYTFTYANIDGSNEVVQTLDKTDFIGKTLAYFSIENAAIKDIEPEKWDLLFTRYSTPLDDGAGGVINYTVTGVLSNNGVEVAQADEVDPATVDADDYEDDYSTELSTIGYDWKAYDFASGWVLPEDRVYFVKSAELELWKVQFIDFEGSSSGVTTIQKTFETALTSVADHYEYLNTFTCYPNPAHGQINVVFELANNQDSGVITIFNALGQHVYQTQTNVDAGLNVKQIPLQNIPAGNYYLSLQLGNDVITNSILIR